jgi:hypothetical protein
MAQKFLYIVDHYIPFPSSEYGGVWNVIAENDDECFDLISAQDEDNFYEEHYVNLRENIQKSDFYGLSDSDALKSKVVMEFTT